MMTAAPAKRDPTLKSKYRYRLKSLGESSAKYGPCEVCERPVSEVWLQTEMVWFEGEFVQGWTYYGCRNLFGHRRCLLASRR
jgi:hypothetical protein